MTPEKAIEYAKKANFCAGCTEPQFSENAAEICDRCEHRQFFEMVIGAIETLLIPKKPNRVFCPACNFHSVVDVVYGDRYPHCHNCGQAIDWTEDN